MQDRNNIQNNKSQTANRDQKDKSSADQKSRSSGQTEREQKPSDRR